jgi:hypothetical protein
MQLITAVVELLWARGCARAMGWLACDQPAANAMPAIEQGPNGAIFHFAIARAPLREPQNPLNDVWGGKLASFGSQRY